jgi:hypothetical protein
MKNTMEDTDVGLDPVAWVERLRDVSSGSKFRPEERKYIELILYRLASELASMKARANA